MSENWVINKSCFTGGNAAPPLEVLPDFAIRNIPMIRIDPDKMPVIAETDQPCLIIPQLEPVLTLTAKDCQVKPEGSTDEDGTPNAGTITLNVDTFSPPPHQVCGCTTNDKLAYVVTPSEIDVPVYVNEPVPRTFNAYLVPADSNGTPILDLDADGQPLNAIAGNPFQRAINGYEEFQRCLDFDVSLEPDPNNYCNTIRLLPGYEGQYDCSFYTGVRIAGTESPPYGSYRIKNVSQSLPGIAQTNLMQVERCGTTTADFLIEWYAGSGTDEIVIASVQKSVTAVCGWNYYCDTDLAEVMSYGSPVFPDGQLLATAPYATNGYNPVYWGSAPRNGSTLPPGATDLTVPYTPGTYLFRLFLKCNFTNPATADDWVDPTDTTRYKNAAVLYVLLQCGTSAVIELPRYHNAKAMPPECAKYTNTENGIPVCAKPSQLFLYAPPCTNTMTSYPNYTGPPLPYSNPVLYWSSPVTPYSNAQGTQNRLFPSMFRRETEAFVLNIDTRRTDTSTSGTETTFSIPTSGAYSYNWSIDWGDGNVETASGTGSSTSAGISHTYTTAGAYVITISPNSGTDGWFRAFGFWNNTSGANVQTNKNKVVSPSSALSPKMFFTASQISSGGGAVDGICRNMFYGCKGYGFTMGAEFGFDSQWDKITTVGAYFCGSMFSGCSGPVFNMTNAFRLPPNLTSVGNYFCENMFSGCSGAAFTMNSIFTIPTTITSVGTYFCYQMFANCTGAALRVKAAFTLPPTITTAGSALNYFCAGMFDGCNNSNFNLSTSYGDIAFQLPQNMTGINSSSSHLFERMFANTRSVSLMFTLPQNTSTSVGDEFCYQMCDGANNLSIRENFNLPQKFTSVGQRFCCQMFRNCTNISVSESIVSTAVFKFPAITSCRQGFAAEMFSGCSSNSMRMPAAFNLPTGSISILGSNFCYRMFYGCSGSAFTMNSVFNLPTTSFVTQSDTNFCQEMFGGCSGAAFTMNSVFRINHTSGACTKLCDNFCAGMFYGCSGTAFNMGAAFKISTNTCNAAGDNVFYQMFYQCTNNTLTMGSNFALDMPSMQTVGIGFCSYMFYGCGGAFNMNSTFQLPQAITSVGVGFCHSMFYGCSGTSFTMNSVFKIPPNITTVGAQFCQNMFSVCNGTAFKMGTAFNLPTTTSLTSVGAYFCSGMFSNCNGSGFNMNSVFNLPQSITTVGNYFCEQMFTYCTGSSFNMNSVFQMPKVTLARENASTLYFGYRMFYNCSGTGFRVNSVFVLPNAESYLVDDRSGFIYKILPMPEGSFKEMFYCSNTTTIAQTRAIASVIGNNPATPPFDTNCFYS